MARYRVKVGQHREGECTYKAGEIVRTDRDLIRSFGADKFELVLDPAPVPTVAEAVAEAAEAGAEGIAGPPASTLGADVTGEFEGAEAKGYRVFHKGRKYTVVDAKDPETPINDEPITTKAEVKELIAK